MATPRYSLLVLFRILIFPVVLTELLNRNECYPRESRLFKFFILLFGYTEFMHTVRIETHIKNGIFFIRVGLSLMDCNG